MALWGSLQVKFGLSYIAVIAAVLEAAARCGAAAPAVPVKDTIKQAVPGDGKTVPEACLVRSTPDRSTLYAVQTPQCFDRAQYLTALQESEMQVEVTPTPAPTDALVEELQNEELGTADAPDAAEEPAPEPAEPEQPAEPEEPQTTDEQSAEG